MSEFWNSKRFNSATAGLAAALVVTGCTQVNGNGFVGARGECLAYDADVELAPEQSFKAAAKNMAQAVSDSNDSFLEITNRVGNQLELDNSRAEESHFELGSITMIDQVTFDTNKLVVEVEPFNGVILYKEEDGVLAIETAPSEGDNIQVSLHQNCQE